MRVEGLRRFDRKVRLFGPIHATTHHFKRRFLCSPRRALLHYKRCWNFFRGFDGALWKTVTPGTGARLVTQNQALFRIQPASFLSDQGMARDIWAKERVRGESG